MTIKETPVVGKKVGEKKPEPTVVSMADFLALKKGSLERERKLKEQLGDKDRKISELESEAIIAKVDVEDEGEVSTVKQMLLRQDKELRDERARQGKNVASFLERERKVRAREIVAEYKLRGVELDSETLEGEEDMERVALDRYAEHLAEENKKLKEATPEKEELFEMANVGFTKKTIEDVNVKTPEGRQKLAEIEEDLKQKALSK